MEFKVGYRSDIGMKRKQNQDNGAAFPELSLFVVADGMGGHQGGETASSMVIKHVPELFRKAKNTLKPWDGRRAIHEALAETNRIIFQMAQSIPSLSGMGTTTTALLLENDRMILGHVGDSRCYFFRPGCIWQLTRDHSLVQEKLRAGLINRSQLKTDRMKNVITRSVGFEPTVGVDIYEMTVQSGDTFLICSDGLSGLVEDPDVLQIVQSMLYQKTESEQAVVDELIKTANAHGGDDNVTALMVRVL